MKEQIKTPEKELANEEIDNLPDAEFKTLVIGMLTEQIELLKAQSQTERTNEGYPK